MIGYDLIKKDTISIENELENVKQKCKYLDTILFLKNGGEEDKNILHIWTMKNINNKQNFKKIEVKIPSDIKEEQKIIIHESGNYIKEKNKYSNLVINILVKGCRRK